MSTTYWINLIIQKSANDHSTNVPVYEILKNQQWTETNDRPWIDAPVTGGTWGAEKGELVMMVGGAAETLKCGAGLRRNRQALVPSRAQRRRSEREAGYEHAPSARSRRLGRSLGSDARRWHPGWSAWSKSCSQAWAARRYSTWKLPCCSSAITLRVFRCVSCIKI